MHSDSDAEDVTGGTETVTTSEGDPTPDDHPGTPDAEASVAANKQRAGQNPSLSDRAALLGGISSLAHFVDAPDAGIDITRAHPGSLPQFITGRSTLLSNLFRDEVALRSARLAAERIAAKDVELRTARGLDAVHLAVGIAAWEHDERAYAAPVLLRPLTIRRHQGDFDLTLRGSFAVNPVLTDLMREQFGIDVDERALAALAYDQNVFKPQPVIDKVRAVTAQIPSFAVHPRLIVSAFADVSRALARDLVDVSHPVIDALSGIDTDTDSLRIIRAVPDVVDVDERPPAADRLLLDADTEQEAVLRRIAAGQSLAVHTLPGTGGTQTVINAVGELVRAGKRVLVVSARRSTLDGVRHRLARIGLPGLAVSPRTIQRDLIRAIGRNEKAETPKVGDVDDALVRLRAVLKDYRASLTQTHALVGVSPLEALRALTLIAAQPDRPTTSTRFDMATLHKLSTRRAEAADTLASAARLGEFRFGPDDSPWYGVAFRTTQEARSAHDLAIRLHRTEVPSFLERGYEMIAQSRMRPFGSLAELGSDIRLLQGIRSSLDKFSPTVFERPIADLIEAHGHRRDSPTMTGSNRRRLRALAKEYVRPGMYVSDMHESLLRVQQQRTQWQRVVESGVTPEIPVGLDSLAAAYQRVDADLTELDRVLDRQKPLANAPVPELVRTLAGLAADSDVFENLVERATLRATLAEWGLEPLLAELSMRHVPESDVQAEFDFAWWQSALEAMIRNDRSLLGANTELVDRLERDFRLVDEAHVSSAGPLTAAELATRWKIAIVDEPDEATALKKLLRADVAAVAELQAAAPTLMRALAPVWIASPYDVPQIPTDPPFDVVIIADAGSLSLVEAAPALRRADQVVVFGDPVTQRPTAFRLSVSRSVQENPVPADERSLFESLADILPVETLTRSYRAGGEDLAELVNDAFYGGELSSLPWAGSYLGRGSLSVDYVSGGTGTPDPETGAVESPDAEVARVVTLVLEHAVNRPGESLMVITASPRHAERVRASVEAAFVGRRDVADFISRDTAEPLAVLTLEESVAESRDRVIFSLGFGLTKHGRVLSDFGDLSTPDGERLLTVGMTRARRSMVIVSSIRPSAFDDGRLDYGAASLMTILGGIAARAREARLEDLADPLTLALARHLRALGVAVDVNYRGLLPLVAQHRGKAVVVEADPETTGDSLRESLRLRPQILRRLGWHYVRVHAFDLYSDPAGVASRVAGVLGVEPETPTADATTEPLDYLD